MYFSGIPRDLVFGFPGGALLLFALILFFVLFWSLSHSRLVLLKRFSHPSLHRLVLPRSTRFFWIQSAAYCCAWLFAVQALMEPKGNGHYPDALLLTKQTGQQSGTHPLQRKAHEVIFFLDTSNSMAVADTRVGHSRLSYAKEIIEELVSGLEGEDVALYSFTSVVTPLVPPTLDYFYLRLMLRQVGINEGDIPGTDFLQTLADFRTKILLREPSRKLKTLIVLSDGGDTTLETLQGAARNQRIEEIGSTVADAEKYNLRVFTIGMGTKAGLDIPDIKFEGHAVHSLLEDDLLKALSQAGRGVYYASNDYTALSMSQELIKMMKQDNPYVEQAVMNVGRTTAEMIYDLYYQFPLGIAIIALCVALAVPLVERNQSFEKG